MSKANVLRLLHLSDTDPALAARLRPMERWSITAAADALAAMSEEFGLPFTAAEALEALACRDGMPLYPADASIWRSPPANRDSH